MMHPYATNLKERKTIPLFIAAFAFIGAFTLGWLLGKLLWQPPAWLEVVATAALFGVGYELFCRGLWRLEPLRVLGWVSIPDLEGEWKGEVVPSFGDHAGRLPVSMRIVQTWTEISIQLSSGNLRSESLIGSILVGPPTILSYEYRDKPLPHAVATLHTHRGTARLELSGNGDSLNGEYYSGRDRQNCGGMHLRRVVRKIPRN